MAQQPPAGLMALAKQQLAEAARCSQKQGEDPLTGRRAVWFERRPTARKQNSCSCAGNFSPSSSNAASGAAVLPGGTSYNRHAVSQAQRSFRIHDAATRSTDAGGHALAASRAKEVPPLAALAAAGPVAVAEFDAGDWQVLTLLQRAADMSQADDSGSGTAAGTVQPRPNSSRLRVNRQAPPSKPQQQPSSPLARQLAALRSSAGRQEPGVPQTAQPQRGSSMPGATALQPGNLPHHKAVLPSVNGPLVPQEQQQSKDGRSSAFLAVATALQDHCRCGRYEDARQVLAEAGARVLEAVDAEGRTPLLLACAGGHGRLIKLLLRKGADINAHDSAGCTALHTAVMAGHKAVARHLLEAGADVLRCNSAGVTGADLIAAWAQQHQQQQLDHNVQLTASVPNAY